jgi:hypothetical protein
LAGLDADGLGKHVEGDGFLSGLKLAITAKTTDVLQETPSAAQYNANYEYCLREVGGASA